MTLSSSSTLSSTWPTPPTILPPRATCFAAAASCSSPCRISAPGSAGDSARAGFTSIFRATERTSLREGSSSCSRRQGFTRARGRNVHIDRRAAGKPPVPPLRPAPVRPRPRQVRRDRAQPRTRSGERPREQARRRRRHPERRSSEARGRGVAVASRSILLVAQLTPPSGLIAARRAGAFAKYLGRLGHRVTVLTSRTSGEGPIEGAAEVVRTGDALATRLNWRRRHFEALSGGGQSGYSPPSRVESWVVPDLAVGTWLPFALPRALSLARKQRLRPRPHELAAPVGAPDRARPRPPRPAVDRRAEGRLDLRASPRSVAVEGSAQAGRGAREAGRPQGERDDRRNGADRGRPERAPRGATPC